MTETKCDLCGEQITGPVSKAGVIVRDPMSGRRPPPGADLLAAFGLPTGLKAEVQEFDLCYACGAAILAEFLRRRQQVRTTGRVVRQ